MAERYPGGVISKTPPTVTGPAPGTGGAASGVWTLSEVLGYVKAGNWPGAALPFNYKLYSWGFNSNGSLGLNDTISRSSPVQVGALTDWSQIAVDSHVLAVKNTNTLYAWGRGDNGASGLNDQINRSSPVQVGALTNWSSVAAGDLHSLAVKTDGTLWAWGKNNQSQLGFSTSGQPRSSPIQVGSATDWNQVSAGNEFSVGVKTGGTLWSWGVEALGRLGNGLSGYSTVNSPAQVGALTNWAQVSTGGAQCVAVKTDSTLWAWGRNGSGQLGDNTTEYRSSPVQVGALTTWVKASAGGNSGFAVKSDGTLWAWGINSGAVAAGQLGLGDAVDRSSPTQVGALTNWSSVSGGSDRTAAIKTDGTLWTWGRNFGGVLGDGTAISRSSPVQIGGLTIWDEVSNANFSTSMSAITKGP